MDTLEPSRMLLEVASWRVATEIARRHPQVRLIETHPGGGQYDCLHILLEPEKGTASHGIALNRPGSAHIQFGGYDSKDISWTGFWTDYLAADDPRDVVQRLCGLARLPQVSQLPRSTRPVLAYRFVAAFLASTVFGRARWECRSGYFDSSGEDCSLRDDWFAAYPKARTRLLDLRSDDFLREPGYRFWFLVESGEPKLCLETTSLAWDLHANEFDLKKLYGVRRRVWPVVSFVAGDLLP